MGEHETSRFPREAFRVHARGLRPRGARRRLALSSPSVLPSTQGMASALPVWVSFRGSIPGLHAPLSTLRDRPHERPRKTRGRCGSLLLHRAAPSSATPRRSPGALLVKQIHRRNTW